MIVSNSLGNNKHFVLAHQINSLQTKLVKVEFTSSLLSVCYLNYGAKDK